MADPTVKDLQLELDRISRAAEAFMKALAPIAKLAKHLTVLEQRDKELKRSVAQHEESASRAEAAASARIAIAETRAKESEAKSVQTCHAHSQEAGTIVRDASLKAEAILKQAAQREQDAKGSVTLLEARQRELVLANQQAEAELKKRESAIAEARHAKAQILAA